ncbi:DUF3040 domain-containing protein [Streptomyces sp. R302]|uniref:DUF3040 domain-containing protein n=1 Tax=unclassified Streptomyces TaxID=2593676 RepID=UPI00145E8785|nr:MULTISPECIES: DUF3040 domain-containing protein [unclassified Streptomyces]NML49243.1 DUF3040 domain-containing protein [Streptomyces sp. R301]NML77570.1 DUF3040 domain-containing protein [Streptomyces sp. R302]
MSHPSDDRSDLAAIERALTRDDPALAATMDTLNQQFPEQSATRASKPTGRRDRRVVMAFVLGAIALLALLITGLLTDSPSPGDEEPGVRPAALAVAAAAPYLTP